MPYIDLDRRKWVAPITADSAKTPGELNFQIAVLVDAYLVHHGLRYTTINDAVGALECNKLETYRRLAVPYEDVKIVDNGDVYTNPPEDGS